MRSLVRTVQLSQRDPATGFVTFQPDAYSTSLGDTGDAADAAGSDAFACLYPYGVRARPKDPSANSAGLTVACSGYVVDDGDEGFMVPTEDPRYQGNIPDEGSGGTVLYGVRDDGTTVQVSAIRVVGAGVTGETEGNVRIEVPYAEGTKTHVVEIDLGANKIRLAHGDGPTVELSVTGLVVTAPQTNLGAAGGNPIVVENGVLSGGFAALTTALAEKGITWSMPSGYTASKVWAT